MFDELKVEVSNEAVRAQVLEELATAEERRRVSLILTGLEQRKVAFREVKKLSKPDSEAVSPEGVSTFSFTPTAFKARKAGEEKLERIEAALKAAWDDSNYEKLEKLGG